MRDHDRNSISFGSSPASTASYSAAYSLNLLAANDKQVLLQNSTFNRATLLVQAQTCIHMYDGQYKHQVGKMSLKFRPYSSKIWTDVPKVINV